jgi:deoxyadenosine/deoxycytidine kinase
MKRISQRDRPYERNMEWDYIEQLNQTYESFFAEYQKTTHVLAIDTSDLDFVRSANELQGVENRIRQALQLSPFQPELPLTS